MRPREAGVVVADKAVGSHGSVLVADAPSLMGGPEVMKKIPCQGAV
jgi:hypothetical protein